MEQYLGAAFQQIRPTLMENCCQSFVPGAKMRGGILALQLGREVHILRNAPREGLDIPMNLEEFAIGHTFSHYRLVEKLGEGGMGIVYGAEDTNLRRPVAIKFLHWDRNKHPSRARFLREARSASILNHPNIATVYDYGETGDGRPFIVMELLRGQTLSDLIEAGTLTLERSIAIIESVLEALVEAHRHGIVHRDIKPSNIAITGSGLVKVLDFGLAKSMSGENIAKNSATSLGDVATQTLNGVVLGTPLYVSPEQATGALVDSRSDLFSIGAVLYESIAQRRAFGAPSVVEIFAQILNPTPPRPPSTFNPSVTSTLDRITLKALAKSVEDRYQSAEAFLQDLRQARLEISQHTTEPQRMLGSSLGSLRQTTVSVATKLRDFIHPTTRVGMSSAVFRWPHLIVLTLSIALALALVFGGSRHNQPAPPIDSVAVIPFLNENNDENTEYLSDGFTDAVISSLQQVSDLKVISRDSVARYKGKSIDPVAAGSDLSVGAILTGRIHKIGDDLNVVVELIDTHNRARLLLERYTQKISDVLSIQADIAQKIVSALRHKWSSEHQTMAAKRLPDNPAAYDLYLKGRWYWNKMTVDGAQKAVSYFQKAIDVDPDFALAYVGMADTYMLNSWVPTDESYHRAKAAAERALQLNDNLGEAHATIGFIKTHYERDWAGAERELKRAIELSPNYSIAHHWYADHLLARGRLEPYLAEMKRARELDPLSPMINVDLDLYYFYNRDYDKAIEALRRTAVLFPDFHPSHTFLASAYAQKGMYKEAIAEYQKSLELSNNHTRVLAALGYTYAISGDEAAARGVLSQLVAISKQKNVSPYRYALVYSGLGDKDQAFKWLDEAFEQHDIMLIYVKVTPFSDPLRKDPRFAQLVQRMGL